MKNTIPPTTRWQTQDLFLECLGTGSKKNPVKSALSTRHKLLPPCQMSTRLENVRGRLQGLMWWDGE